MAGPWEKYQTQNQSSEGPWTKYQQPTEFSEPYSKFEDRFQKSNEPPTYDKYIKPAIGEHKVFGFDPVRAGVDIAAAIPRGLARTGQTLGKAVAAGIDPLAEKVLGPERMQQVQQERQAQEQALTDAYKPSYEGLSSMTETAAPMLAGGLGGLKMVQAAGLGSSWLARAAAGSIGAGMGQAASQKPGANRILTGKDASLPIIPGFKEDTRLKTFANDMIDASILAFGAEAALRPIIKFGEFAIEQVIKPALLPLRSDKGIKSIVTDKFAQDLEQKLGALSEITDPQEKAKGLQDLAQLLRDNAEIKVQNGETAITIPRTSMRAAEEGFKQISSEPTNPAGMAVLNARQLERGYREGAVGTAAHTSEILDEPVRAQQTFMGEAEGKLGGLESAKTAEENIRKQAQGVYEQQYERPVVETERQIAEKTASIPKEIQKDLELGARLEALDKRNVNINILRAPNQTVDVIRDKVRQAYDVMKTKLDDAVQALPDDTFVDTSEVMNSIENLPSSLKNIVLETDGNYKELYTKAVPKLSREITTRLKAGKGDVGDLITVRNWINENGPSEEIRRIYRDEWAPIWRDGKLEDFGNIYSQTVHRGKQIRPVDFEVETRKLIEDSIKDPAYAEHLSGLLSKTEGGGNPKPVIDYILSKTASDIQSEINAGKSLVDINVSSFTKPLEKYGSVLERINPEGSQRINEFLTKIRDAKSDVNKLSEQLDYFKANRKVGEDKVFKQEYGEFFKREGITGTEPYQELFSKSGNLPKLERILEKSDPETKKGLQSAYLRHFKNELFGGSKRTPAGSVAFDLKKWKDIEQQNKQLIEYGDTVFKDTPGVMETLKALTGETSRMQESIDAAGRGVMPFDFPAWARESTTGWDKIITVTFGVLNRMAARARAVKGAGIKYLDPKELAQEVAETLMSNPEELAKAFEGVAKNISKQWTPEKKQLVISLLALSGKHVIGSDVDAVVNEINSNNTKKDVSLDTQTKQVFGEK